MGWVEDEIRAMTGYYVEECRIGRVKVAPKIIKKLAGKGLMISDPKLPAAEKSKLIEEAAKLLASQLTHKTL